jgi:hypothetical protein
MNKCNLAQHDAAVLHTLARGIFFYQGRVSLSDRNAKVEYLLSPPNDLAVLGFQLDPRFLGFEARFFEVNFE